MTHRGPFQPLPFCDSVIQKSTYTMKPRHFDRIGIWSPKLTHTARSRSEISALLSFQRGRTLGQCQSESMNRQLTLCVVLGVQI